MTDQHFTQQYEVNLNIPSKKKGAIKKFNFAISHNISRSGSWILLYLLHLIIAKISFNFNLVEIWDSHLIQPPTNPPTPNHPWKFIFRTFSDQTSTTSSTWVEISINLVLSNQHPPNHHHLTGIVAELQLKWQFQQLTSTTTLNITSNLIELGTAQPQLVYIYSDCTGESSIPHKPFSAHFFRFTIHYDGKGIRERSNSTRSS